MKNKKGLKIILGIVGVILLIFAYFISRDLNQEDTLRDTINNYIENQIVPDKPSTSGEYYKIEKEILNYLTTTSKYTEELTAIFKEIYDFEFYYSTHAYESLKDDFSADLEKIEKLKNNLNNKINQFIELNNYETLLEKHNSDDEYYNDLYIELLGSEEEFDNVNKSYNEIKTIYTDYFINANNYIEFLKNSSLTIDDNKENMTFDTDEEISKYGQLADALNLSLGEIVATD